MAEGCYSSNAERKIVYTINLDELDMLTIPVIKNYSNNGLLWSTDNTGVCHDDNYYKFHLEISTNHNEHSPANKHKPEMYTCHICNINLPIVFIKEHMRSAKHKTYSDIANNALLRIQKNANQVLLQTEASNDESVYFCCTCSMVIEKKNKKTHEKSKTHIVSNAHEKMLMDLATLYINDYYENDDSHDSNKIYDKNIKNHGSNENHDVDGNYEVDDHVSDHNDVIPNQIGILNFKDTNNTNKQKNKENVFKGTQNYIKCETSSVLSTEHIKIHKDENIYKDSIKKKNCKQNKKNIEKLIPTSVELINDCIDDNQECDSMLDVNPKEYIFMLKKRYQVNHLLQKLEVIGDYVKVEAVNGDTVYIEIKNYFGDNGIGCELCGIKNCEFTTHMFTKNHIKRLLVPIQDKYCLRKFSSSGHCLVCNEYITADLVAIHHHQHRKVVEGQKATVQSKTSKQIDVNNDVDLKVYTEMKSFNNEQLKCRVCKIPVPKSKQNVVEHILGKSHRQMVSQTKAKPGNTSSNNSKSDTDKHLNENKKYLIRKLESGIWFCAACLVNVPDKETCVLDHVNGKTHKKKVNKI